MKKKSIIDLHNFILSTRDSGYKNTASALAELTDNAIEASATRIHIEIKKVNHRDIDEIEIRVSDNGKGMNREELNTALQFGGSTRFNSRKELGRYGMGLPNSSLSQCRRIEIKTWQKRTDYITSYLDIDEVIEKDLSFLPTPKIMKCSAEKFDTESGTVIKWKKCDRISFQYIKSIKKLIHAELGRIFRYPIWRGVKIYIDGEEIKAFDPLYIGDGTNLKGGIPFGEQLFYKIKLPGQPESVSTVIVKFIQLPVQEWQGMSNEEKRFQNITKKAGVSVLRAEREIDYGWFFMGDKRKENYDDWWRCEIKFNPELDELFGVTHTKQGIKETPYINEIFAPDFSKTARLLNSQVRLKFSLTKTIWPVSYAKKQLERTDIYLPAIRKCKGIGKRKNSIKGYDYILEAINCYNNNFYEATLKEEKIILYLNTDHNFYSKLYTLLHNDKVPNKVTLLKITEILLFSAARAEMLLSGKNEKCIIAKFKLNWSNNLKTFLS